MTNKRVIGIGETVLDILFKEDQPQKAVPGGSTFNSIVSLGRAGVPCAMVTEVGGDHVGDIICRFLQDNGVSSEYVCRHEQVKSHISLAFLDENNDAHYVFYKNHASVSLDGKLPKINENDVVLFGSFFAINPVIRPVVGNLLRAARKAGAWLYYDINFRKNHIADLPEVMGNIEENMSLSDVVRGSMEDFGFLYGLHDGDTIYKQVSKYCNNLILTDGARKIQVFSPDGCDTYPVEAIETVSTVGAGDNFNAGYIYALLQGFDSQAKRIEMAKLWSQDVCRQLGNNISDQLVRSLAKVNLESDRIILRPWRESDAESLYKYASDPEVGPRAGWPPHKSVEESREIIRTLFNSDHIWAIVLKETDEPIGCMGYFVYGESNINIGENDVEAGYWVARPYWNKGICTEALRLLIDYCFNQKGFQSIWSDYFPENPASGRVMEKCGFRDTGEINYCSRLQLGSDRPVKIMLLNSIVYPLT